MPIWDDAMTTMHDLINWQKYLGAVKGAHHIVQEGRVVKVSGIVAEANGPGLSIGSLCTIQNVQGEDIEAEVVGFKDNRVIVMPLGELIGVKPGSKIIYRTNKATVPVGDAYLGRVIDGLGRPLDNKGAVKSDLEYPVYGKRLNPMNREIIRDVLDVGVRSINALTTIGKGQRIAIMAGSGVGKSVLMGMIARNTSADVIVIGLIGERGREVREFVERNLGEEGLKKSIVVAATSDMPALVKIRGSYTATALAEYFRDNGLDVILIMDSITRYAMSLREVGLAAGEPPSAKGYTPSVFNQLPKIMERAGTVEKKGSITGIYNVLVDGDDMNEPIADAVRSIADGHIVLSRALSHKGHYPAVDTLASISRVMNDIVEPNHLDIVREFKRTLSVYRDSEDLINIGAYVDGSDPEIDYAKSKIHDMDSFLQQRVSECVSFEESVDRLKRLLSEN
jgi:flagellum-specific ATP synthase